MTLENTEDVNLDFALTHAVNLAEAGDTVQNKRIGTAHTRMITTVSCSSCAIQDIYTVPK